MPTKTRPAIRRPSSRPARPEGRESFLKIRIPEAGRMTNDEFQMTNEIRMTKPETKVPRQGTYFEFRHSGFGLFSGFVIRNSDPALATGRATNFSYPPPAALVKVRSP